MNIDSVCVRIKVDGSYIPKFVHPVVAGQPLYHRISSAPSPCSTFAVRTDQRVFEVVRVVLQKVFQGSEHVDDVTTENLSALDG
jgi:hypothetical protein